MTEAKLQRAIQKAIKDRGGKVMKLHGGPYSVIGQPDLIGVLNGVSFVFEAKVAPRKATPRQEHELAQWRAQGWVAGVVYSVEQALGLIQEAAALRPPETTGGD